ncbi:hypothetical protein QJS66_00375 [Kocuria rhizophila]|nr:hypothetical protein QJS66_00375 [Kocuria rhizophila]
MLLSAMFSWAPNPSGGDRGITLAGATVLLGGGSSLCSPPSRRHAGPRPAAGLSPPSTTGAPGWSDGRSRHRDLPASSR